MKPTYHKESKNFADGCASHYQDYFIENSGGVYGRASLASGLGTIIFERLTMKGDVEFESSHHCMIGVTGVLCNPQYIFTRIDLEINKKADGLIGESTILQRDPFTTLPHLMPMLMQVSDSSFYNNIYKKKKQIVTPLILIVNH